MMPLMNQKPTLLFVAPSAYPLGGVQTWLDYLLPGLEKLGFNSVIGLTNGKHHDAQAYLQQHPFANFKLINNKSGTIQGRIESLEKLILEVNPDIIIVVNIVDTYQALNNLRQKKLSDARIVTSIHGIQDDLFHGIKHHAKMIDGVISTNKLTQKLLNAHCINPARSFYSPYGVKQINAGKSHSPQKLTISYAGRFDEQQKRIQDLLLIFSRLLNESDDFNLLIAGDGENNPKFTQWLSKEKHHAHKINYLGVVAPENMVSEVYQKSDILLLTSSWETGPIVAWEAMNYGVCLVSSRYLGSFEEGSLINGVNCQLFDIGDIDEATTKVCQLIDPNVRKRLIQGGHKLISDKYSHSKSIASWANNFTKILNQNAIEYEDSIEQIVDNGRMSYAFKRCFGKIGLRLAEKVRRFTAISFDHHSAGSEWPHKYPEQIDPDIENITFLEGNDN